MAQCFHQVVVGHRLACSLGVLLATVEHVLHVRDDLGVVLLREVWRVAEPAHQLAHHPAPELHAPRRAQRLAAALDQLHHLRLGQPQAVLRRRLVADGQVLPRSGPLQLRRNRQIETHAHHLAQGYTANPAHMHDSTFHPFCDIISPDESGELMNPPLF
ncbi:MAG: hypothetical protein V8S24_06395 [Gordonibacter pamelaeae]